MSTKLLLTEGGIAGHMSHLYDNQDLTFAKLKEILNAASNGELEGTEKTDGQNLFISYSAKRGLRGAAKGSRNKGHVKAGGLNPKELYDFFEAAHPGKDLSKAFSEALATFEKSVKALPLKTQVEIFGPDSNIWYNAEVMDSRTPNVVEYDTKSLVIHRAGHGEFDKATGAKTDRDVSAHAKVLDAALPAMQQATDKDDYTVHVNAIRTLEALEDDKALNIALEALSRLQSDTGVGDDATITQFMVARVAPLVASLFDSGLTDYDIDQEVQKDAVSWILGGGTTLNQVKDSFEKEDKARVSELLKNHKKVILKQAIAPLEDIVHDFSVEMLRGLESAFILDNRKEVDRLQKELNAAKEEIESGARGPEAIEILMRQMKKIKKIENFATAAEGFVFDFEGVTYKFTGNFAPANQIIGIAKYGRGSKADDDVTVMKEEVSKYDAAIFPGAFKPPHRGHLALVDELANQADKVIILMSETPRKFESGKLMTWQMAKWLWELYLLDGYDNVELRIVSGSPVSMAYDFVEDPGFHKDGEQITILAGVGGKGSDPSRFKSSLQDHAREDVSVSVMGGGSGMKPIKGEGGKDLSATDLRNAIEAGKANILSKFLPDFLKGKEDMILKKLKPAESTTEMINRMIHEQMDENTVGGGGLGGYAGPIGRTKKRKPKKKNKKRTFEEEVDNYNEIEEITNMVINKLKGRINNAN